MKKAAVEMPLVTPEGAEAVLKGVFLGAVVGGVASSLYSWGFYSQEDAPSSMAKDCLWLRGDPQLSNCLDELVNFYSSLDADSCRDLHVECDNLVRILTEASSVSATPTLVASAAQH